MRFSSQSTTSSSPKRKIRVIKQGRDNRVAIVSFGVVISTAVILFMVYRVIHTDESEVPSPRDLREITIKWKCEQGHLFHAGGAPGSRKCIHCGAESFAINTYYCSEHGAFEVQVNLHEDWSSTNYGARDIRFEHGEWVSLQEGLKCPRCGRPLRRALRDGLGRPLPPVTESAARTTYP